MKTENVEPENCGIVAMQNPNGLTEKDLVRFAKILVESRARGRDAAGVATQDLGFLKSSEGIERLVNTDVFPDFLERAIGQKYIIGHTRAATQGNPDDNFNNHPLSVNREKFLIVHNGAVKTSDWSNKRRTDSYVIAESIARELGAGKGFPGAVKDAYKHFDGKAAIFAITPTQFVLAKKVNPIVMAKDGDVVAFASEARFLEAAGFQNSTVLPEGVVGSVKRNGDIDLKPLPAPNYNLQKISLSEAWGRGESVVVSEPKGDQRLYSGGAVVQRAGGNKSTKVKKGGSEKDGAQCDLGVVHSSAPNYFVPVKHRLCDDGAFTSGAGSGYVHTGERVFKSKEQRGKVMSRKGGR